MLHSLQLFPLELPVDTGWAFLVYLSHIYAIWIFFDGINNLMVNTPEQLKILFVSGSHCVAQADLNLSVVLNSLPSNFTSLCNTFNRQNFYFNPFNNSWSILLCFLLLNLLTGCNHTHLIGF